MLIDVALADSRSIYQTLISVITPRPIARVTTIYAQGRVNLAPFSFFNTFGGNPPIVIFAPNRKRDGSKKDTLCNVEATGEFVVNVAVAQLADAVIMSSTELPPGESEVELTGLHVVPSQRVRPPRLRDSPVQLECLLRQVIQIGEDAVSANLVIGEVALIHVAEDVLDEQGRVDPRKLRTIGRLGGDYFCHSTDVFEMRRP